MKSIEAMNNRGSNIMSIIIENKKICKTQYQWLGLLQHKIHKLFS